MVPARVDDHLDNDADDRDGEKWMDSRGRINRTWSIECKMIGRNEIPRMNLKSMGWELDGWQCHGFRLVILEEVQNAVGWWEESMIHFGKCEVSNATEMLTLRWQVADDSMNLKSLSWRYKCECYLCIYK